MVSKLRMTWWDWNPKRLRRLLAIKDGQIRANQNGWANTHLEVLALKKQVSQLEAERDQWQRQVMGHG
jgi:hypothetical protein